jgi:hypothetical protein
MTQKIIHPFGWLAGKEGTVPDVIEALALEMLGYRSDLQERAQRKSFPPDSALLEQAENLEKYAVILNLIYLQLKPERWNASAMPGLLELAAKHELTLPEWMAAGDGENGGS